MTRLTLVVSTMGAVNLSESVSQKPSREECPACQHSASLCVETLNIWPRCVAQDPGSGCLFNEDSEPDSSACSSALSDRFIWDRHDEAYLSDFTDDTELEAMSPLSTTPTYDPPIDSPWWQVHSGIPTLEDNNEDIDEEEDGDGDGCDVNAAVLDNEATDLENGFGKAVGKQLDALVAELNNWSMGNVVDKRADTDGYDADTE